MLSYKLNWLKGKSIVTSFAFIILSLTTLPLQFAKEFVFAISLFLTIYYMTISCMYYHIIILYLSRMFNWHFGFIGPYTHPHTTTENQKCDVFKPNWTTKITCFRRVKTPIVDMLRLFQLIEFFTWQQWTFIFKEQLNLGDICI